MCICRNCQTSSMLVMLQCRLEIQNDVSVMRQQIQLFKVQPDVPQKLNPQPTRTLLPDLSPHENGIKPFDVEQENHGSCGQRGLPLDHGDVSLSLAPKQRVCRTDQYCFTLPLLPGSIYAVCKHYRSARTGAKCGRTQCPGVICLTLKGSSVCVLLAGSRAAAADHLTHSPVWEAASSA